MEKKRWSESTPPNFDVRIVAMKNKALLQPCNRNRNHEIKTMRGL
jgi:hypothetical protein